MVGQIKFTPTERRILHRLADGMAHTRVELLTCLNDPDLSDNQVLSNHISRIKNKIEPYGETIICEYAARRIHYRHVRIIR